MFRLSCDFYSHTCTLQDVSFLCPVSQAFAQRLNDSNAVLWLQSSSATASSNGRFASSSHVLQQGIAMSSRPTNVLRTIRLVCYSQTMIVYDPSVDCRPGHFSRSPVILRCKVSLTLAVTVARSIESCHRSLGSLIHVSVVVAASLQ